MTFSNKVQKFLKKKLKENNLERKDFAQKSGIPYTTVNKLINAIQANPELKTLLKISNYFKCSLDEVMGRKKYHKKLQEFKLLNISTEQINYNLRNYIKNELDKNKLTSYKLSKTINFSEIAIFEFMKGNKPTKTLGSAVTVALADYFQISIDEMIGRIKYPHSEEKNITLPKSIQNLYEKNKE